MTEPTAKKTMYATASMAEVFLSQNLVSEAQKVIAALQETDPSNPRLPALVLRLEEMRRSTPSVLPPPAAAGVDRVALIAETTGIGLEWEITEAGLAMAERAVRYSGRTIVRLFTAAAGPRGVRTQLRDIDVQELIGRTILYGLPRPSVHTAAVGYLANTGVFVSAAQSPSLKVFS